MSNMPPLHTAWWKWLCGTTDDLILITITSLRDLLDLFPNFVHDQGTLQVYRTLLFSTFECPIYWFEVPLHSRAAYCTTEMMPSHKTGCHWGLGAIEGAQYGCSHCIGYSIGIHEGHEEGVLDGK